MIPLQSPGPEATTGRERVDARCSLAVAAVGGLLVALATLVVAIGWWRP